MGTLFKKRNKWGINYIDHSGKRVRKVVSPYKEMAERALKKVEIEIFEGKYIDVKKHENVLFEDFAKKYFDAYVKVENRNPSNQQYVINGLVSHFRGEYLHQISPFAVRQYMGQRKNEVKPSSVNKDLTMLKSMYNRAKEWQLFSGEIPTNGIKKLPENNERCRWLNEEEQERLLSFCRGATKAIVLVALKTGMRWGEIVSLKWKQIPRSNYVDFENKSIFLHESLTKSKKSRYIPLAHSVQQTLMDFPQRQGTDYIFLNPKTDKPIGSVKKSFKAALAKSGIKNLKFHDLRHCFASQLVRKGVDLYAVQQLLGHSSPKMTQRYAHLRPDHLKDAIDRLEKRDCLADDFMYNKDSLKAGNGTVLAPSQNVQSSQVS